MKKTKEAKREDIASRARWSGTIRFGLVGIPVYLFPANRPAGVGLRMLDQDGIPLARRWWCPKDEAFVDADEIIRGHATDGDEYVVVTDEELEAIEPKKSREIDLRQFVPVASVDPRWFQRGYYLAPAGESTKAYRLLAEVMERTGRAGIATFVMRAHEYLDAIVSARGILRAETLRSPGRAPAPVAGVRRRRPGRHQRRLDGHGRAELVARLSATFESGGSWRVRGIRRSRSTIEPSTWRSGP